MLPAAAGADDRGMRSMMLRLSAAPLLVLAVAGCGSEDPSTAALPVPGTEVAQVAPSVTAGRLGEATTVEDGVESVVGEQGDVRPGAGAPPVGIREGVDGAASCGAVDVEPTTSNLAGIGASTLCLLNAERAARGLGALTQNAQLDQAAVVHAKDMVARTYFGHQSPDGTAPVDRIRATGYIPTDRAWTVGENLAWGSGVLATPAAIVRAWMNSPGHRDNILKPAYKEIGLGLVAGVPKAGITGGATFATTFGGVEAPAAAPASAPQAAPVAQVASDTAAAEPAAVVKKAKKKVKKKKKSKKRKGKKVKKASTRGGSRG